MRKKSSSLMLACLLLSVGCAFGQYAPNAPSAPQQVSAPQATQSPEPAIDCAGHADGLYVRNPSECNDGFYKCANDRSFYYRCPTGLFFSIEDAQCEYRQLIPACGGQRPVEATTPAQTVQVYQPTSSQAPPVYQPPQTQAPPVYQPPQTQAPPVYQPPQTQAPVYVQPTTTQAPVYQPPQTQAPPVYQPPQTQAPVYQQPTTTQAPVYQPLQTQAPVYVQPTTTQAPVYQPPQTQAPPVYQNQAVPSYQISYGQQASSVPIAVVQSQQPQYAPVQQAPVAASIPAPQPTYQYGSQSAPAAPQLIVSTRPPVNFNCQGQSEGYHAKRQCADTVYYSCVGGIATELTCPQGTVFDSTANACDYPNECGKPKTTTGTPLVNYGYGWQRPTTTPPSTLCNGRMDGFYARGHCVKDYLHCTNGIAFELKCPAGLVFRNDSCTYLNDCIFPTTPAPQLAVQTGPTLPPLTWCRDHQRETGFYSQGCSAKFYSCNGGFTSELSCPGSLVYDQTISQCEERQFVVACGGRPRPPTTTTIAAPVAPVRRPNFNCQGQSDGFYTSGCSGTYYVCVGGQAINSLQCPASLAYDQTAGACEERQYVVACGGRPRPPTTTPAAPVAPVRQSNFNCNGITDGYYYDSRTRCSSTYYHCSGGSSTEIICPPGTNYSPQIHACDYRGNIPECGGVLPTTTQPSAPIAVGNQGGSGQYGYAPQTQPPPQAPVYQQPTTTQAPVYQPPQTQAPVYQPPQTQAPPVYVQPTTTQAPVYQPPQTQAPVYVQPTTTQAPVYQPPQTQAPVYVQPSTQPQYQQYSAPSYQQQQVAQQPLTPVAVAQPEDSNSNNQCAHLQNGIYGRKCSRHYIVCTDHKIFEFTCPSGFAYDRTIARCGPVDKIQGCSSQSQAPPSGFFFIRK